MAKKAIIGTIEEDTDLIVWLIAETVCSEILVERIGKENLSTLTIEQNQKLDTDIKNWTKYLSEKAESLYKNNERIRNKIKGKGNTGRDYLYMIMYHWMGVCDKRVFSEQIATNKHKYEEADKVLKIYLETGEIR